jgi:K+-sensing histidine kinase KdpD
MREKQFSSPYGYLVSAAIAALATGFVFVARASLGLVGATVIYLLTVVVIGARIGRGPALMATALSVLGLDYFVIPPILQFEITELRHIVMLGGIGSVAVIVSNLTERLRKERDRAAARDKQAEEARQAVEAERTRNAILSTVSHDLRTPLATISASTQLLARNHESMTHSARSELLTGIAEQADRLEELLRNVVAMTRAESQRIGLQIETGSVQEVIGSALRRGNRIVNGRTVNVRSVGDAPYVAMDASLLEQVFVNLLENAVKYSPASSPVEVTMETTDDEVVVKVEDRGSGVPEDELEKIFEKFYRGRDAPKSDGGIGLGLSICRAIVAAHGGAIHMSNRDGGGATVSLSLPAGRLTLGEAEAHLPGLT